MAVPDEAAARERVNPPVPAPPVLSVRGVSKRFGGVQAVRDASLDLAEGSVLALVGENGAGKSTLINIVSGVFSADAGTVELHGERLALGNPHEALRRGIAVVHQELTLFGHLTIWENIFAGHEPTGPTGRLQRDRMIRQSADLFARLGMSLDPTARVQHLSLADQQMVEIAKALSWDPRILILDEATSALDTTRVERVFETVDRLKEQGVGIIFVSHRLPEVFAVADQAVVLKDGQVVASLESLEGVTEAQLIEKMVGRSLAAIFPAKPDDLDGQAVLSIEGFSAGQLQDISLSVREGEIVGLGGLQGHGQEELLQALFGAAPFQRGRVTVSGKRLRGSSPGAAIDSRIAYVPPDRKTEGLFLPHPVEFNLTIVLLRRFLAGLLGMLRFRREDQAVAEMRRRLRIRQRQWHQPVESLSGGNQQKVVLGKWMETGFDLLLMDEPTRGIDVATKAEVYHLLRDLAESGKAILVASTDAVELLGLCDRVYVLYEGRIQRELQGEELSEYNLTHATMGVSGSAGPATRDDLGGKA